MALPLNLRIAISSLSAHKLRAILAMLGVFLGALAFTGVQHVSKIMVKQAEMETEKLGPNLYAVMAGQIRFRKGGGIRASGISRNFTLSDAKAVINGVPSVLEGAPFVQNTMAVRGAAMPLTRRWLLRGRTIRLFEVFMRTKGIFLPKRMSRTGPRCASWA